MKYATIGSAQFVGPFLVKIKQPGLQVGSVTRYRRKSYIKSMMYMNRRKLVWDTIKKKNPGPTLLKGYAIKCKFNDL